MDKELKSYMDKAIKSYMDETKETMQSCQYVIRKIVDIVGLNEKDTTYIQLIKAVKELKQQWISVEDRLPEVADFYLVIFDTFSAIDMDNRSCQYFDGSVFPMDADPLYKVTHWMPLPEPQEEK